VSSSTPRVARSQSSPPRLPGPEDRVALSCWNALQPLLRVSEIAPLRHVRLSPDDYLSVV
jgi:hypothetical protein